MGYLREKRFSVVDSVILVAFNNLRGLLDWWTDKEHLLAWDQSVLLKSRLQQTEKPESHRPSLLRRPVARN